MIHPELHYWLWRSEQSRRDVELERRRSYLQADEPDLLRDLAINASEAPGRCDLEVAS